MSQEIDASPTRRAVLAGVGSSALVFAVGIGTATADEHIDADVFVTLDNVGASAWEVTDVEGDDVAPIGDENPTLTLSVGTRYAFENGDWSGHPLAFRDEDTEPLLSQADTSGEYADDPDVDWIDEGEQVVFTLTTDLAQDIHDYICTAHNSMNGDIEVTGLGEDPPDEDDENDVDEDDPDDADDADDDGPGFGAAGALAGVGGVAAYALRRTQNEE